MVGMQSVVSTTKAGEVASHALYPRASNVLRIPPLGNDEASGSCWIDHASPAVVLDKGIVFLGRPARERLKPMRVVCGPHVHSPLLHACCYAVSYLAA